MARRKRYVPEIPPYEGDRVTVRAGAIVAGGSCIAHLDDGRVVFVAFAAPGELVEAEIERVHADYLEAAVTSVLEASSNRVTPRCGLFGDCGGCQLQHLSYAAQVAAKEAIVREQVRRIAHLDGSLVVPMVAAAEPWAYRNNLRLSTGRKLGDVGFIHRRGRGLLKVEHCDIAHPALDALLPPLQGHGAGLHQVQLRTSADGGSRLVYPAIDGVDVPTGQRTYVETLAGHGFEIDIGSFFQVNHAQAEEMARLCGEALPAAGQLFIDAFAGVGTFARIFADRFERVIAIEESKAATERARRNVKGSKVEVHTGRVEEVLPLLPAADAVLLDPPRAGCHPAVIDTLVRTRPSVVVYVSCNPATLARDLRLLADGGFTVDRVTPLDMFPQTGHIEAVARLSLRDPILPPAGRGLPAVILASASPRRRELLPVLVPEFTVAPADIPEPLGTDPVADAIALAEAKARAVAAEYPGAAVIAADTVVHDGVRHFGKPASEADARAMLRDLAGREHRVVTGVAVATGAEVRSDFCEATVTMRARDDAAINAYVSSGIPLDKAGAYGIQDDPQRLVERLDGCYCTVVGLPLWSVRRLLHAAGVTDVGDPGAALRRCAECPDRLRGAVG